MPAQLSLADFRELGGSGSAALGTYAVYALVTVVVASLAWAVVGVLIAWRKWRDPMALFVSAMLITYAPVTITFGATPTVTFGAASPIHVPDVLARSGPVISVLGIAVTELFYPTLAVFLLTFPIGRFAPRQSALIVLLWMVQDVLLFVGAPFALIQLCLFASTGSIAVIQVYRYARRYAPLQRQQTKWVVGPFAFVALPLYLGYTLAPVLWPSLNAPGSAYRLVGLAVVMLGGIPIPLGIGIAILSARLYDIDVIIRRTLIYGSLIAVLAALYVGLVLGAQTIVGALTGQKGQQPLIIVASTLLIAALFTPLRQRIQAAIDRCFYRRNHDAARTLTAFGAALSTETNLEQLSAQIMAVVEETMHPAHARLWLRPSSLRDGQSTLIDTETQPK